MKHKTIIRNKRAFVNVLVLIIISVLALIVLIPFVKYISTKGLKGSSFAACKSQVALLVTVRSNLIGKWATGHVRSCKGVFPSIEEIDEDSTDFALKKIGTLLVDAASLAPTDEFRGELERSIGIGRKRCVPFFYLNIREPYKNDKGQIVSCKDIEEYLSIYAYTGIKERYYASYLDMVANEGYEFQCVDATLSKGSSLVIFMIRKKVSGIKGKVPFLIISSKGNFQQECT